MATTLQNCDEDIIDSWSTQATQGSDSEEENNARIDRQPPARYPISEADFVEFLNLKINATVDIWITHVNIV